MLMENVQKSRLLKKKDQQVFKIKREDILVVKIEENFFALNDKCPHAYLSLQGSDIDMKNETIAAVGTRVLSATRRERSKSG